MPSSLFRFSLVAVVATALAACAPEDQPHEDQRSPTGEDTLTTNFSYSVVNDSTIAVNGELHPLYDGFEQMYLIGDTLFYVSQVSPNNYILHNRQSDEVLHRIGLVVFDGDVVYSLARSPGFASVSPLVKRPAFEVDASLADSGQLVTVPGRHPVSLQDSVGYSRKGPVDSRLSTSKG